MFVAGEIKQKLLRKFSEVFFYSPFNMLDYSWMYYNTVNVDNDWMTNVDKKTGYGNIQVEDFVKLVENLGFRVDNVKTVGLDYKISEELVKGFVDAAHQNVWPEITGLERKEFFAEFIGRAEKLKSMVRVAYLKIVF